MTFPAQQVLMVDEGINEEAILVKSFLIAFLSGIFCLWAVAVSHAAPVTFRFEAVVASVGVGLPPLDGEVTSPLPFPIDIGDLISIIFGFSSSDDTGSYPQFTPLCFSLSGHELFANTYEISVIDNGIGVLDVPGRVANPAAAGNVDRQAFFADRIALGCVEGSGHYCGTVGSDPELQFIPTIIFEDENLEHLESENLPTDPRIWNSFSGRELSLLFNNRVYVGAYLGMVNAVPEPSGISCLVLSTLVISLHRFYFRQFGHT